MTTDQSASITPRTWNPILKPAEIAEARLIKAIIDGTFPINTSLPAERELAGSLGVTRPTLREALQRLERDGWIEIHQGKPTRIRDYWKEGKLGVLNTLSTHAQQLPNNFIIDLLQVRQAMAPAYTAMAVVKAPQQVVNLLNERHNLGESPERYAQFDWSLQHGLSLFSENPVFVMILNGFEDLFLSLAPQYFNFPEARAHSYRYYQALTEAAQKQDDARSWCLTEEIMKESIIFWQKTSIR
jgi:GntR family negative regulator for fad regulon and positive regulator of fabA